MLEIRIYKVTRPSEAFSGYGNKRFVIKEDGNRLLIPFIKLERLINSDPIRSTPFIFNNNMYTEKEVEGSIVIGDTPFGKTAATVRIKDTVVFTEYLNIEEASQIYIGGSKGFSLEFEPRVAFSSRMSSLLGGDDELNN